MPSVPVLVKPKRLQGQRINVPSWLTNPDSVAPCLCGRSLLPGEPYLVVTGELGLRRWFHGPCWAIMMGDDWDDEENGWDED